MTPAQEAEADRVEIVYHWALTQVGAQTIADSLALWQDVPATQQAATNASWLSNAIRLLMLKRGLARSLAIAYYRLVRALRTGTTIDDPRRPGTETTLEALRQDFEDAIDAIVPIGTPGEPRLNPDDDDIKVPIEPVADLKALSDKLDDKAAQEAGIVLDQLGIENMLKKFKDVDDDTPVGEADTQRDLAHRDAGARQAAAAARIAMNGGRLLVHELMDADLQVLGWARYSTTGSPCGWCAMLISRKVFYKSQASARPNPENVPALKDNDANEYHDNDYCIAIPVFTQRQFDSSKLFDLNREMRALWKERIEKKFNGKAALTEWRSIIRERKFSAAQEAA